MQIIILGAGQIGGSLAQNLAAEDHNITVVDLDEAILEELAKASEVQTVLGNGSTPGTLLKAGINECDVLIALTSSDEVNILACHIAGALFKTPKKIARIHNLNYLRMQDTIFNDAVLNVDFVINSESLITQHLKELIEYPLLNFLYREPKKNIVVFGITAGIGVDNKQITAKISNNEIIILSHKHNHSNREENEVIIKHKDEVIIACHSKELPKIVNLFSQNPRKIENIFVVGGGRISQELCFEIEESYNLKIIDHNKNNLSKLSKILQKSLIFDGDALDKTILTNEQVHKSDIFFALTNKDEVNIFSCLLAKKLGANKVVSLVTKKHLVDISSKTELDSIITPHDLTLNSIVTMLYRNIHGVYKVPNSSSSIYEIHIKNNLIADTLSIAIKQGIIKLIIVYHGNEKYFATNKYMPQQNDTIVFFVTDENNPKFKEFRKTVVENEY